MSTRSSSLRLVLDWDGTMTMNDTTSLIGEAAIRFRSYGSAGSATMSKCVDQYTEDYNTWKTENLPSTSPKDLATKLQHLDSMASIEARSFLRVRHAALQGYADYHGDLNDGAVEAEQGWEQHMRSAGANAVRSGRLSLRDPEHLRKLLRWIEGSPDRSWAIVSVSWSREYMLGAMIEAGLVPDTDEGRSMVSKQIFCNELLAPLKLDCSGKSQLIQTAGDKLRALKEAISTDMSTGSLVEKGHRHKKEVDGNFEGNERDAELKKRLQETIYVGDSTTDLGCLAAAKLGVCMRNVGTDPGKDKLLKTLETLQIGCPRLSELSSFLTSTEEKDSRADGASNINVYWTTSFQELDSLLHGIPPR